MPQLEYSSFLPQLFWLAVSFTAIFFLTRIFVSRIGEIVSLRHEKLQKDLEIIKKSQEEAVRIEETYVNHLNSVKIEASAKIENAIKEGGKRFQTKEKEIDGSLKEKIESAKQAIDSEIVNVRKEIHFLLPTVISQMVNKVAGFEYKTDNIKVFLNKYAKNTDQE